MRWARWLPGLLLTLWLLGHASGSWTVWPVRQLDAWAHDLRVRGVAARQPDDRVAIVAIDERALAALGRWPWNRARIAEIVEILFTRYGITALGLDMILAEADQSSGLATLEGLARGPLRDDAAFLAELRARRAELDHDGRLAGVLRQHPVVLGFHLSRGAGAVNAGTLPPALTPDRGFEALPMFDGHGGNFVQLQAAATGAGFLNADIDPDGVRRRAPLLARHGGQVYPAFALALTQAALGGASLTLATAPGPDGRRELQSLKLTGAARSITVPLGPSSQVLMPYPARSGLPTMHSVADVLAARVPDPALRGRVVLLGAVAPGLADLHATPVAENLPGVQGHASLLSALLMERVPREPTWAPGWHVAQLLIVWLVTLGIARQGLRNATLLAAGTASVLVAANLAAWVWGRDSLPLAGPLLLLALLFLGRVFVGHFFESRDRRRLAALFGQYVPPELVEHMAHDPARYDMQGRSADLSVMFADLRGFTALSESLPPTELATLMNEFLSVMTDIVRSHGGTLDKYVGDAVMAFWGAPVADPDHARHAVAAALAMQAAMTDVNRRFAQRGWPALTLGIGINSGSMVVGDLGSRHRRAYTVLGDAVNVAARLQELCSQYRVGILIGQNTREALGAWPCDELDTVVLRGRKAHETIFVPRLVHERVLADHDRAIS